MAATFYLAACYEVTAKLMAPLRTGAADGDTETVLCKANGQAFIQGTSLAGAMRSFLQGSADRKYEENLFGSQASEGHLIVSEGLFAADAEKFVRPRLKINGASGTAEKQKKFDVAHIGAGETFTFMLTWLGTDENKEECSAVERLLAAMDTGAIRLGAQKTNGFGRVSLKVKRRIFDLRREMDREDWLNDSAEGCTLHLPALRDDRHITFEVRGRLDNLLVKSAAAEHSGNSSYTPNMTEGGCAVLPGSSVKGAIRAHVVTIAAALGIQTEVTDRIFGREAGKNDNGLPGIVIFEDVRLERAARKKITRICIDRFSGSTMQGALFAEEPLSSAVTLRITVPEGQETACGLLLYALRDLALGLYGFGSGRSIGRGMMKVDTVTADTPKGRLQLTFDSEKRMNTEDPAGCLSRWMAALKNGGKA